MIFKILTPFTWKIIRKTMMDIVHNTQEIILKQTFSQNCSLFGPMTSSLLLKSTFWAFWANFCRLQPFIQLKHGSYPIKP